MKIYVIEKIGRGKRIRTSGPCLPKAVLYRAELLSDAVEFGVIAGQGAWRNPPALFEPWRYRAVPYPQGSGSDTIQHR